MADTDASTGRVLKEGHLGKCVDKIPLFSVKPKQYWWVLSEAQENVVMSCYKDDSKSSLKDSLRFTNNDVEVDMHDNYISLKLHRRLAFLRAETRQQRDEWYRAIMTALGAPALRRRRAGTESTPDRPRPKCHRPGEGPQTAPSLERVYQGEMKPIRPRPRPLPPPPPAQSDVEDEACIKNPPPYCCYRHHVLAKSRDGTNMTDNAEAVYANIHFVRSKEEWIMEVETRRQNLGHASETYSDLSRILLLQGTGCVTEVTVAEGGNDLGRDGPKQRRRGGDPLPEPPAGGPDFRPNLVGEDVADEERRTSLDSNEDNTVVGPVRPPPPIPSPRDEALVGKVELTRSEQKESSVSKVFQKKSVLGDKVRLMVLNDGIYVIAVSKTETSLRGALKVGDQVIRINKQILKSATFARETISSTDENEVTFLLKRLPHGRICTIKRNDARDDLGITLEKNEITWMDSRGLASVRGDLQPQATGVTGHLSNWAITEINTQPVDLFASTEEVKGRLARAGEVVSLVLQPVDFVQKMRDQLQQKHASP